MAGTILVTGGAGYIGSHVVLALRDTGREVVVLDNLATGSHEAVPVSVPFYKGSAGDRALVKRLLEAHGVRDVMHLAASTEVEESVRDPEKYFANNTGCSRALIEVCLAAGVERFVFSSTAAVYGEAATPLVAETAPVRPINPYGESKARTERDLAVLTQGSGLRYVILRYFNAAGADPALRAGARNPRATHLIKLVAELASGRRDQLTVFGTDYPTDDGTCVRDYIHVADIAGAHLAALRYLREGGDSLTANCGYGKGHSVREVIAAAEQVLGRRLNIVEGPRRPGDCASIVADPACLKRLCHWAPEYDDLHEIIHSAIAWERGLRQPARHRSA